MSHSLHYFIYFFGNNSFVPHWIEKWLVVHIEIPAKKAGEAGKSFGELFGDRTLLPKTEIPYVGCWGVFADLTGNRIALNTSMGN